MTGRRKFLFVINPIAGDVDKSDIIEKVQVFAADVGVGLIPYETTGEDDEQRILDLYQKHQPERVLVTGGDGTVKMVADALEKHDVVLGILPGGSANGLSVDLALPKDIDDVLQVAFGDTVKEVDMVDINGHRSLHLSDIGLNAELIKNYEKSSIRGKLGYVLQAINTLTDDELLFEAKVETDEKTIETTAKMIVIANSKKYGTGVTINPVGDISDGMFEIIIIKNLDIVLLGKIITGNFPLNGAGVELVSTHQATITTNIPVHFQVDGEYLNEVSRLEISILPRRMKVAVPDA